MRGVPLLAAMLLPLAARAQPVLSLRVAYAPSLGEVAAHVPMSEAMASQIPAQLDALWRIGPLSAGGYASYGIGQTSGSCADGAACAAWVVRTGVQALYAPQAPRWPFLPWAGAGLGYEWATRRRARGGSETTYTWRGWELLGQAGADWPLGKRLAAGPFLAVGLGRYARVALETSAASGSAAIADRALHAWIHLGVRARFEL